MTRKESLAYCAGIIDGEGYIGIKKAKAKHTTPGYHARLQLRMVHEGAVRFLAETLGGWYYREKSSANNGKPLYAWQVSDKAAESVLQTVLPYLRVKADSARTVLELRSLQADSVKHRTKVVGYRDFPNQHGAVRRVANKALSDEYVARCDALWLRCKELNRVGVAAE